MTEIQRQPSSPVWNWRAATETAVTAGKDVQGGTRAAGGAAGSGPGVAPRPRRAPAAAAARRQGAIGGACGLVAAAALAWWLHRPGLGMVVAAVSLAIGLLALGAPLTAYARLRAALDRLGHWVGTAVTWALMTVLFYLLFLPVGLVLRAARKLTFTRFVDPRLDSYWTPTAAPRAPSLESYRRQF